MQDLFITIEQKLKSNRLTIPSLPENAVRLRRLASDPNATLKDVSELISQDANTSAQIIRMAQTFRYSNPGCTITSLQKAIGRIGFLGTINLVLAMTVLQGYHFHSKTLYSLCQIDNAKSRLICRYALTAFELIKGKIIQEDADFISLASIFLNIGCLPIYSELDSIVRITSINLEIEQIKKWTEELKVNLGMKILEKWNFDHRFSELMQLKIKETNSLAMNCVIFAAKYVEESETTSLIPLSNEISESFLPIPEGKYKDTFVSYLEDNNYL